MRITIGTQLTADGRRRLPAITLRRENAVIIHASAADGERLVQACAALEAETARALAACGERWLEIEEHNGQLRRIPVMIEPVEGTVRLSGGKRLLWLLDAMIAALDSELQGEVEDIEQAIDDNELVEREIQRQMGASRMMPDNQQQDEEQEAEDNDLFSEQSSAAAHTNSVMQQAARRASGGQMATGKQPPPAHRQPTAPLPPRSPRG